MTIGQAIVERMIELNFDTSKGNIEYVATALAQGSIWIVSRPTNHFGFVPPETKMKRLVKKGLWPSK